MGQRIERLNQVLHSQQGRNVITFLIFVVISAVLWIVQSLNEEAQRDLRLHIQLTNVPDSVTRISKVPEYINVNVRSRGTTLLKYQFESQPSMSIDYRQLAVGDRIVLNDASLKAYFRQKIGGGAQIMGVNPDSLAILFTRDKGVLLPVKVDAHVVPGPQFAIIGKVRSLTDSVRLYSLDKKTGWMRSIITEPIVLNDVTSSQTLKVALLTPPDSRCVPDSVNVYIDVEPLVSKSREIEIKPVNVPSGYNLVLSPRQVEVYYMVPMSIYKSADSDPKFTIEADYNSLSAGGSNGKIAIRLTQAPKDFIDVFLTADSVGYIIESVNKE